MNITVFSGGSGNTQILKALHEVDPFAKINVIVNAYDNGKSTGICRKITNTLGVSDIRKNQYKIRKLIKNNTEPDGIDIFMEERFDLPDWPFTRYDVLDKVSNFTGTHVFDSYINDFFDIIDSNSEYTKIKFKSFNLSNIVYASMFKNLGYKNTIDFFNDFLGIDTSKFEVLVNSYDNVFIKATTLNNEVLEDEADIVDFANRFNKINSIVFTGDTSGSCNYDCIKAIEDSDLLIISTGTFWSSLYPTFEYSPKITKAINSSPVRKLWFMNTAEDKDTYGVSVSDFIKHLEKSGLNVSDFRIVENRSAVSDTLKQAVDNYTTEVYDFGNNNGKHDVNALISYFKNLLCEFFNVKNIYVDFDDTLWSRNKNEIDRLVSIKNISALNTCAEDKNVTIISGNTKEHVFSLIKDIDTENLRFIVDSNSKYFDACEHLLSTISSFNVECPDLIKNIIIDKFPELKDKITSTDSCIKIRPVTDRDVLIEKINMLMEGTNNRAFKRGRTTIDILNNNNNKANALSILRLPTNNSLYLGDEICCNGNDNEIAQVITNHIHINSVFEMYTLLRNFNK